MRSGIEKISEFVQIKKEVTPYNHYHVQIKCENNQWHTVYNGSFDYLHNARSQAKSLNEAISYTYNPIKGY